MQSLLKNKQLEIKKVLYITLGLNLFVSAIKIISGEYYGFLSLTSSGLDSLFDGTSNILALFATSMAYRPADSGHNYGHAKYENLGGLVLAILLMYSSFQIGSDVLDHFGSARRRGEFHLVPIAAIGLSMLVSKFVSWYEHKKGSELNSPILHADAQHTHGDFIISGGVLCAIFASYFQIYWVDLLIGSVICLYLFFIAIKIIRQNIPYLVDSSPEIKKDLLREIEDQIPEVRGIHHFRVRGDHSTLYVDFHILLDETLSLLKAHEIGHKAEDIMREKLANYAEHIDITVHTEPFELDHQD